MATAPVALEGAAPPVRVDVLGPLVLWVGDAVVSVPGPKRRALLALLAMAEGRAVPVGDLCDALWRGAPPATAKATLHSHVSRLRRHLGPAAGRLEGLGPAYRLVPGAGGANDVEQVRDLLARAGTAAPQVTLELLRTARAMWRGPPLEEFADVEPLMAWAVALDALRRAVEEAHVTAAVEVGTADAVELAEALVTADPLDESAALLMVRALHGAGRTADALRSAYEHRRRLAAEVGLEASAALADLEREVAGAGTARLGAITRPGGRLHGRDAELAALHRLLDHERLVTVLGPGGVGKTRLALEAAARLDDVTALRLDTVTDPAALPHVLADALGLTVARGDVLSACAALLGAGPHLLLVDCCEHLLSGVRGLVGTLLAACPRLRVLATSREPLGLADEQQLRIGPLRLPGAGDQASSPAVALFVDRARRARPGFRPGPADQVAIADLVRRLDGLPLAIELAAGRLSSMGLGDLHDRLDRALDLLGDRSTGTLRQTIAWSYELLADHDRRLFCHLSAFPDGVDLATAESVAEEIGLTADPAGVMAHLVDASMVDLVLGDRPLYRMLDSMRAFGLAQPETHGGGARAEASLRRWALALVTWIDEAMYTDDTGLADAALRREIGNLRAAWRSVRDAGRLDDAVALVVGLGEAMGWRDLAEPLDWALELAEDPALAGHRDAPAVLGTAAACAWERGELDRAQVLADRGLAHGGEGTWLCRSALGLIALSRGDIDSAVGQAVVVAETAPRPDQSLGAAALATAYAGDLDTAHQLNARFAAFAHAPTHVGFHRYVAAEIAALSGQHEVAAARYEEAIRLARGTGATFLQGVASVGQLTVLTSAGRITEALAGYGRLLDYWERTGAWVQQWTTLRNLAALLRTLGDDEVAAAIDYAADAAPDAPAVIGTDSRDDGPAAPPLTRAAVLHLARQAVERQTAGR